MAQTFEDGESAASVRTKLNANADEIDENALDITQAETDILSLEDEIILLQEQKLGVADVDVSSFNIGDVFFLAGRKNEDSEPEVTTPNLSMDQFISSVLAAASLTPDLAWVNFERTLTGDNTTGALGRFGQIFSSQFYDLLCVFQDESSAKYRIDIKTFQLVRGRDDRNDDIIDIFENATGWVDNFKTFNTVNAFVGETWMDDADGEGYVYRVVDQSGTTFTVKRYGFYGETTDAQSSPATYSTLVTALEAHDWSTGWYDQSVLSSGDQAPHATQIDDSVNGIIYWVCRNSLIAKITTDAS